VLAQIDKHDARLAELLSIYVIPELRVQGLATALLAGLEDQLAHRGVRTLAGVYMTGKPAIPALERVFEKRGFSAPRMRMVAVRITPEEATRTPWYHKGKLPEGSEVFLWSELTAEERAGLQRSQEKHGWIPHDLEPWRYDGGFDPVSSIGLRKSGEVVGWIINHRIAPDMVRFTDSYVRPDCHRLGALFPLLAASLERLRGTGVVCTFVTSAQFGRMLPFVQRRIAPFGHFFGETLGVTKALPAPAVEART
jgi:GNAT superfamily N-acetyltransferase